MTSNQVFKKYMFCFLLVLTNCASESYMSIPFTKYIEGSKVMHLVPIEINGYEYKIDLTL